MGGRGKTTYFGAGERLRADVRSPASGAMATLRELIPGPRHAPHSVRLRPCLAVLHVADALNVGEIGPTSADGAQAKLRHDRFLESLGAWLVERDGLFV